MGTIGKVKLDVVSSDEDWSGAGSANESNSCKRTEHRQVVKFHQLYSLSDWYLCDDISCLSGKMLVMVLIDLIKLVTIKMMQGR